MDNLNLTDFVSISNHIHRRLGRQIGLWAWQGFELGCSFVLPWLVAGELSPAKSVEADLAATQQKLAQTQLELKAAKAEQVVAQQNAVQQVAAVQQIVQQAPVQPQVVNNIHQVVNQHQVQNQAIALGAQNPSVFSKTKDFIKAIIVNTVGFGVKSGKFLFITLPTGIGYGSYYALRGSFRAIKWVDGSISRGLGFVDEALNTRFKSIPGYRLLTWYPLRLGNWEQTYKQTRNYALFVNPLWQRFVQPFLANRVFFADMAKAVSSYIAPYAELGVRAADKAVIGFLSTVSGSAADYGLESFTKSFSGWWNSKPIGTQLFHSSVTLSDSFIPVRLTTVEIEAAAERHIAFLASSGTQAIEKLGALNAYIHGYADPLMTLMATMANDVYRYGNCVANTDRGFMPCTQSAFSHAYYDYVVPTVSNIYTYGVAPLGNLASQYALNPIMQFLQHNRVTGPMFYFGDCVVNGNYGYIAKMSCPSFTVAPFQQPQCPADIVVSGLKGCSRDAMHYMYVDYAQPFMGASWNFVCNSASGIGNGLYNGGATIITGARDGICNGVTALAMAAAANPGTAVVVVGAVIAVPTLSYCAYFTAKTMHERMFYPNGRQHHVIEGQVALANNAGL